MLGQVPESVDVACEQPQPPGDMLGQLPESVDVACKQPQPPGEMQGQSCPDDTHRVLSIMPQLQDLVHDCCKDMLQAKTQLTLLMPGACPLRLETAEGDWSRSISMLLSDFAW